MTTRYNIICFSILSEGSQIGSQMKAVFFVRFCKIGQNRAKTHTFSYITFEPCTRKSKWIPFLEFTDHFLSFETLFDYPPKNLKKKLFIAGCWNVRFLSILLQGNHKESTKTTMIFGFSSPKIGNLGEYIMIFGGKVI